MDRVKEEPSEYNIHQHIKRATAKNHISPADGACGRIDHSGYKYFQIFCTVMMFQMVIALFVSISTLDISIKGGEMLQNSESLYGWLGYSLIVVCWNAFVLSFIYSIWQNRYGEYQYADIKAQEHVSDEWYRKLKKKLGSDYQPLIDVMIPSDAELKKLSYELYSEYRPQNPVQINKNYIWEYRRPSTQYFSYHDLYEFKSEYDKVM